MSILAIGAQKPDMDFDEWLKKAGAQFGINPSGSNSVGGGGGGGNDLRSDFEKKHNLKAGGSAWDAAKQDSNITANTSTINRGSEASSSSADNKADPMSKDGSVFNFISMTPTDGVQAAPGVKFAMNPATTQALDPSQKNDNTERSDDSTQGQNSGAKMQTAVSAYEEWCKTHMSGGAGGAGTLSGTETTADTSQTGGTTGAEASGAGGTSGADTTSGPEAKTETGETAETPTKDTTVNDANDQTGVNNDDQTKGKDTSNEGDQAITKQEQKQQEIKMEKEEENKRQQMVREREQQQAA